MHGGTVTRVQDTEEFPMLAYQVEIEREMKAFYDSLNERDRRRYAGVEAHKLGHGGVEYVARLFGCDPKTIRQGLSELEAAGELDHQRQRKKGVDANR